MKDFWLCFVPLFVAVDAIGVLPMFVTLTEGVDAIRRRGIILQSVTTASVVAVAFLWLGPVLLRFLGISVPDFMIAGGILLLAIALSDLLTGVKRQREPDPDSPGAVPIGVPLITGPAVLTTCILLRDMHGRWATTAAVVVNIALAGVVFLAAGPITRTLGKTGTKTVSKLASLLLAAIAVMLVRKGVSGVLASSAG
ncbi:MAG: MarC family protein [Lentisphaerae bacterium]|nr:MarC family protein [Lentisphaerota bacterium]